MILELTDIIGITTTFLLFIFSLVLYNYRKGRIISNKILSAFLLTNGIYILNYLISRNSQYLYQSFPFIFYIGSATGFLFGPLIYLYTKSLTDANFKINLKTYLHFLPSAIYLFYIFINFHFAGSEKMTEMIAANKFFTFRYFTITTIFMNVQIFLYLFISLNEIKKYRSKIKSFYSAIEKINLSWLGIIIIAFVLMWFVDIVQFIIISINVNAGISNNFFSITSLLINLIFATIIVYKGLQHPDIISGFETVIDKGRYETSSLAENEKQEYLNVIKKDMIENKHYLSPTLSLKELSDSTGIPERHLSQVINESLNMNFYDFINSYRIEEAKIFLSKSEEKKTVLEILYDSGFNSKSVFNRIFKESTGMTPTEFRKKETISEVS